MAGFGLARNVVWTYADVAGSAVTQLVLTGYAARVLGATTYGVFALVLACVLIISGLQFTFGFTVVGAAARIFEGSDNEGDRGDVAACHSANCLLALVTLLLTGIASLILASQGDFRGSSAGEVGGLVALTGASAAVGFVGAAATGIVRGAKDYRRWALADLVGKVVTLVVVLVLLHPLGLVALGIGQLAGQVVMAVVLMSWCRKALPWLSLLPVGAERAAVRRVLVAGMPLLAISVGGQIVGSTDLVTVGALVGSAATGLYQLGSTLPVRFVTALFQGYDVAFPYLAADSSPAAQERATKLLTRGFGLVAGLAFGLLSLYRTRLGVALAGSSTHATLSDTVTIIFCAVFAVNTCYHGMALLVISRGRQSIFTKLTIVEALLNVGFTVAGVELFGAAGAAYASLVVIAVFNLVILPWLVKGELGSVSATFVVTDGMGSIVAGVACAAVGAGIAGALAGGLGLGTVVIAAVFGGIATVGAGAVMIPQARDVMVTLRNRATRRTPVEAGL